MVSENKPKIMFRGQPITEKLSFKKLKILLFWAPFISKTKIVGIFNFRSLRYFGYCLSFWIFYIHWSTFVEIRDCWTGYFGSLDTADNNLITDKGKSSKLANKFFWKILSIAVSAESCKFFDPRTVKWRPFEIFPKLNGKDILLAASAKSVEYQSNILTEMHNFG